MVAKDCSLNSMLWGGKEGKENALLFRQMVWWLWKTDLWNTSVNKEIKGKGVMDRGKRNKGREWYCFGSHRRWSFVGVEVLVGNAFRQSGKLSHKIHV
ncbi:hypothetical protein CDAR_542531 [Caerostris darwini]|uniref:Uncharacterized protein n=1 Tax=Caerostris darwini TaxID=1538125 RepID=A0AAV4RTM8_9ARAC|nr:hypothetical protein CDAR_542531 [Caerostris darwini]